MRADAIAGADVTFKLELTQHAGLVQDAAAHSTTCCPAPCRRPASLRHPAAITASRRRWRPSAWAYKATIFVPEISSPVKIAAIRAAGRGGRGGRRALRRRAGGLRPLRGRSGALTIHPYDAVETLEGQGTVALEWEQDQAQLGLGALDTVLVAVGGGGLAAGMAAYWGGRVKVVAVEPEGSRCLHAAFEAGEPVDVPVELRRRGFARRAARRRAAVRDRPRGDRPRRARAATRPSATRRSACGRTTGIASEPGGAAALAALLSGAYAPRPGERVGVLLCGGNVDPASLAAL